MGKKEVLFIHIGKNGGRTIKEIIRINNLDKYIDYNHDYFNIPSK